MSRQEADEDIAKQAITNMKTLKKTTNTTRSCERNSRFLNNYGIKQSLVEHEWFPKEIYSE